MLYLSPCICDCVIIIVTNATTLYWIPLLLDYIFYKKSIYIIQIFHLFEKDIPRPSHSWPPSTIIEQIGLFAFVIRKTLAHTIKAAKFEFEGFLCVFTQTYYIYTIIITKYVCAHILQWRRVPEQIWRPYITFGNGLRMCWIPIQHRFVTAMNENQNDNVSGAWTIESPVCWARNLCVNICDVLCEIILVQCSSINILNIVTDGTIERDCEWCSSNPSDTYSMEKLLMAAASNDDDKSSFFRRKNHQ